MLQRAVSGQFYLDQWVSPLLIGDGKCCIYIICDPRTRAVCYVGKCVIGHVLRWRLHRNELKRSIHGNIRLQRLFDKLNREGLGELCCRPVEFCDRDSLSDREEWWIKEARKEVGRRLCNFSNGGGTLGMECSEETRRKISAAKIGKPNVFSPEGMESFLIKQRARVPTDKQLAALRRGRTDPAIVGRNRESVRRAGRSRKGETRSAEMIEKIKATKRSRLDANVRGAQVKGSKLTDELVLEIRRKYIPGYGGYGCRKLAKEYGVTFGNICMIVKGKTWRHLLGEEVGHS